MFTIINYLFPNWAIRAENEELLKKMNEVKKEMLKIEEIDETEKFSFIKGLDCEECSKGVPGYACNRAAKNGHLKCLKSLHNMGCKSVYRTLEEAIVNGNEECLKFILDSKVTFYKKAKNKKSGKTFFVTDDNMKDNDLLTAKAARHGHLECLKILYENDFKMSHNTCESAALGGNLDCLEYAYENGCSLTKEICYSATLNGHLNCLKYAREKGCEWDKLKCYGLSKDFLDIQDWILKN